MAGGTIFGGFPERASDLDIRVQNRFEDVLYSSVSLPRPSGILNGYGFAWSNSERDPDEGNSGRPWPNGS